MTPGPTTNAKGDSDLDCEMDLLWQFQALVERALKAGWAEDEVANALLSLALQFKEGLLDEAMIESPPSKTLQ
jgi:hypothetical protein